jgi:endo-1,4-beta-xylanase
MNKTAILACLMAAIAAQAQTNLLSDPGFEKGGTGWVFQANAPATDADGSMTVGPEAARTGTAGAQVVVTKAYGAANNWYLQLQVPQWSVKPKSRYSISFWAKGTSATIQMGFLDVPADYAYLGGINATLSSGWKKYSGELVTTTQTGKIVAVGLYLAGSAGTFQFDDFEVIEQPPVDQSWYQDHPRRIDSLRKKTLSLVVSDSTGAPLQGASVRMDLARHSWPFGTALALQATDKPGTTETWYRNTAAELFNEGVFENDFKWPTYEAVAGDPDTARIDRYLKWADSLGMPLRGHALVWGIQQFGFETFWATDTSKVACSQLATNIKARIVRDMTRYKGRMKEYDVWNEPIHEQAFFAKCKDDPKYAPDGFGLMDSSFVWARATDPTAKLYVNEYNNIDGGENEAYYDLLKGMLDRKVPFDGIGVQCHFGGKEIDPGLVRLRIDRLASLGLPLKVTEFDNERMDGTPAFTPQQQAEQLAIFLRLAYGHPAIEGVLLWGFWDTRHWLATAGAGLFDGRRNPKAAADTVRNLWNTIWTTDTTMATSPEGRIGWRGFPGKYVATVTRDGRIWTIPVNLSSVSEGTLRLTGAGSTAIGPRSTRTAGWRAVSGAGTLSVLRDASAEELEISIHGLDGTLRARSILGQGTSQARVALPPGSYLVRSAKTGEAQRATVLR